MDIWSGCFSARILSMLPFFCFWRSFSLSPLPPPRIFFAYIRWIFQVIDQDFLLRWFHGCLLKYYVLIMYRSYPKPRWLFVLLNFRQFEEMSPQPLGAPMDVDSGLQWPVNRHWVVYTGMLMYYAALTARPVAIELFQIDMIKCLAYLTSQSVKFGRGNPFFLSTIAPPSSMTFITDRLHSPSRPNISQVCNVSELHKPRRSTDCESPKLWNT